MSVTDDINALRAEFPDADDDEIARLLDVLNDSRVAKAVEAAKAEAEAEAPAASYKEGGYAPVHETVRTQYTEPESVDGFPLTLEQRWDGLSEVPNQ